MKDSTTKLSSSYQRITANCWNRYLSDRYFRVKPADKHSELKQIKTAVQQGSVSGHVLYLLYTSDLPQLGEATVATFADDTAIMAVGDGVEEATEKLQRAVDKVSNCTRKWLIKLNEAKSIHVDFTNKGRQHITINGKAHTTLKHSEIPWHDAGCRAALEGEELGLKLKIKKKKRKKKYWHMERRGPR